MKMESNQNPIQENKKIEPWQQALLLLKEIAEDLGYNPETKSFFK